MVQCSSSPLYFWGFTSVTSAALWASTPAVMTVAWWLAGLLAAAALVAGLFIAVAMLRQPQPDRAPDQRVVVDHMSDAIVLVDTSGRVALVNARVNDLLGLDAGQIEGMMVADLLGRPEPRFATRLGFSEAALRQVTSHLAAGEWNAAALAQDRVRFEIETGAAVRHIQRTNTLIRDAQGLVGLLMVFSDMTEEHELVQARDEFDSMIVHDLRGPLTAIATSLKLLNEIVPPDDPLGHTVGETTTTAGRAVRKLSHLIDTLLDVPKLERGTIVLERDLAHLNALYDPVMTELAPSAEELGITVRIDVPESLPLLYIDADKIGRVLLNVVDNAIKFTPADGMVTLQAHVVPAAMPDAAGNEFVASNPAYVQVQVRDTGPGVPDEHKARLFDRRALLNGRGRRRRTGLGLIFARLAVEAHGGRIWIEDNPGGGSVFAFTLPVARLDAMDDAL